MDKEFVCRQEGLSSDLQYLHEKNRAGVTACLEFPRSGCRHQESQGAAGWLARLVRLADSGPRTHSNIHYTDTNTNQFLFTLANVCLFLRQGLLCSTGGLKLI